MFGDYLTMENLIDEARDRYVRPYDLFQQGDMLVDAKDFYNNIVAGTEDSFQRNVQRRIIRNDRKDKFYQVLFHYLDSLGTGMTNYSKLEPAIVKKDRWSGKYIPVDGKHRAKLCLLLRIKLPVNIVKEGDEEELDEAVEGEDKDIFDLNHISIPYYNDLLKSQAARDRANVKMRIAKMSPREYFRECAKIFGSTFDAQIRQVKDDKETLDYLQGQLDRGHKFPVTWLDCSDEKTQDGRHRMYVVGNAFGWDEKYPVVVFETANQEVEKQKQEQRRVERVSRAFYRIEPDLLRPCYDDVEELKEQLEWLIDSHLEDAKVEVKKESGNLILVVDGVDFTYSFNDFDWAEPHTPTEDDFDYADLESLQEDVSETGDTVIKAVLYRWTEPPAKPVADFEDFEQDGVYRLGDYDYIAFEKRWRDSPLGWGLIHQDVIDDFVKSLYAHYSDRNECVNLEIDNLGLNASMYYDVQDGKLRQFAKYGPLLRRAVRRYFA